MMERGDETQRLKPARLAPLRQPRGDPHPVDGGTALVRPFVQSGGDPSPPPSPLPFKAGPVAQAPPPGSALQSESGRSAAAPPPSHSPLPFRAGPVGQAPPPRSSPQSEAGTGAAAPPLGQSVQSERGGGALSVYAPEFYPRGRGDGATPLETSWVPVEAGEEQVEEEEEVLREFVSGVVGSLSLSPALYDTETEAFLHTLAQWVSSERGLLTVLHAIYEQALADPNFTYTAARLCNFLSQNLVLNPEIGNFRQQLLKRCHVEYESRDKVAEGDKDSRKRLHAYAIFLTELFLQLQVMSAGKPTRAAILRVAVRDVIHTLLAHPSDDNVTCAIKMLKLCGCVLEDDFRAEAHNSMDELMERMKSVVLDGSCERPVRSMLLKLIELRSSNWDRVTPTLTPTTTHCPMTDPDYYMNEPVFYTTDGTPFTAADPEFREHYEAVLHHEEELRKRFPRGNRNHAAAATTASTTAANNNHYFVDSDSEGEVDDEEVEGDEAEEEEEDEAEGGMDSDMEAAFEIFCQETERIKTAGAP